MNKRVAFIIPVYNRPQEVRELLASMVAYGTRYEEWEVIIVEDGSTERSEDVALEYSDRLSILYLNKPNGGPSSARNFGARYAAAQTLVFLDSDTTLLPGYINTVLDNKSPFWGGADRSSPDFSPMQRAVSYAMTSPLTTGGIRGGGEKMDKFYPRSFNMGIDHALYDSVGGFDESMRYGEDVDLSYRLTSAGARAVLLRGAEVCHKRRTNLAGFFRQVHHSGEARIVLAKRHPGTLKIVHLLPTAFTIGSLLCLLLALLWCWWWLLPIGIVALAWLLDALLREKSLRVALLALPACFTQLYGYGIGFIKGLFLPLFCKKAAPKNF